MKVQVEALLEIKDLIGDYPGAGGMSLNLAGDASVRVLLERLVVPEQRVGLVLINGTYARPETLLHEGDVVKIMPVLEGG